MAGFKQVFGTSGDDNIIASGADNEIIFLLAGNDTISGDFQSLDYIIDTAGNDVLVTGGAFADFSIRPHAGIKDAYLVTSKVSGKVNLVKGIESFSFNEGDASLSDFIDGNAPGPDTFDKIITLDQFVNNHYNSQNGLAEQFQIELASWNDLLTIDGFNANEDQVLIVSNTFSMAQEFVDANVLGPVGAWGWDPNGNVHLYSPDLYELNFNGILGAAGNESIFTAENAGWLKFGEGGGQVDPEVVQVNLSNFVNSEYTALDNFSEVITIPLSQWNENFRINNFDADHDKLVIDSAGQYSSAQSFINANVAGSAGTWAYDVTGGAHLFNPNFNEISLVGITNAENKPNLIQSETEGWIKFI